MTSSFGSSEQLLFRRPESIQVFGTTTGRFMDKSLGSELGPGQYKPRIACKKYNSALAVAGSGPFKARQRPFMINEEKSTEMPAPGQYSKQQLNNTFTQTISVSKKSRSPQFADKKMRFGKDDTIVPGPGTYKALDSCKIRQPKHQVASYRSTTKRELGNHILGKNNPGIGQYDLTSFNAIGASTLEGGGAPNNFTLCYKDANPTIRKVITQPEPRLPNTTSPSKFTFNILLNLFCL